MAPHVSYVVRLVRSPLILMRFNPWANSRFEVSVGQFIARLPYPIGFPVAGQSCYLEIPLPPEIAALDGRARIGVQMQCKEDPRYIPSLWEAQRAGSWLNIRVWAARHFQLAYSILRNLPREAQGWQLSSAPRFGIHQGSDDTWEQNESLSWLPVQYC